MTLGELKQALVRVMMNSQTNLYNDDLRGWALNEAVRTVCLQYAVPQYIATSNVAFSSGVGNLPSDFLRSLALYDSSSTAPVYYQQVPVTSFIENMAYTFSIQTVSAVDKLKIYPTTATSLTLMYVSKPTDMSSDSDTTLLPDTFKRAVAMKAKSFLLEASGDLDRYAPALAAAEKAIGEAWQAESLRWSGARDTRIHSIF